MASITFTVSGQPFGKQRPRHNRFTNTTYTPDKTKHREQEIAIEYKRNYGGYRFPTDSYLVLSVTAVMSIPKSASKAAKEEMKQMKRLPTVKPDGDNILKLVADALNGVAYDDDKQIIGMYVLKIYGDTPETRITISEVTL